MTKTYDEGRVGFLDFEPESDTTGDGNGDPDKFILTIADGLGTKAWPEEIAVIVHRTVDGKYPIDGDLANKKRRNAQVICDALNANHEGETFAAKLWSETEPSTCRHCGRNIVPDGEGRWIDLEAGYDDEDGDGIWRETCDAHDTITAEHEPQGSA